MTERPGPAERDPYRVDPDDHRGHDGGILSRLFQLPRSRRDDDPAGPRRIHPGGDRGRGQ
jgi:hypothetical protein